MSHLISSLLHCHRHIAIYVAQIVYTILVILQLIGLHYFKFKMFTNSVTVAPHRGLVGQCNWPTRTICSFSCAYIGQAANAVCLVFLNFSWLYGKCEAADDVRCHTEHTFWQLIEKKLDSKVNKNIHSPVSRYSSVVNTFFYFSPWDYVWERFASFFNRCKLLQKYF